MRTLRSFALALALLFAAACESAGGAADTVSGDTVSGDTGHNAEIASPDEDVVAPTCDDPVSVDEPAALAALVDERGWTATGGYSSGVLPVTADLAIEGTLVVHSADFTVPEDCLGRDDCAPQVVFAIAGAAGAVVDNEGAEPAGVVGNTRLTLTDTVVRLRPILVDTHPSRYNYTPLVEVIPACSDPCPTGTRRCADDDVCYRDGSGATEYCRQCEHRDKAECACRDAGVALEDGADCYFPVSGDVICGGKCEAGVCDSSEPPGWAGCP